MSTGGAASIVVTALCFTAVHYLATAPLLRRLPSDEKTPTAKDAELHESFLDIGLPIVVLFTGMAYFALVMYFCCEFDSAMRAAAWTFTTVAAVDAGFAVPAIVVIFINKAIRRG